MQLANQRREAHVDDRDVEVDHKRCDQQRDENQGAALHDRRSPLGFLLLGAGRPIPRIASDASAVAAAKAPITSQERSNASRTACVPLGVPSTATRTAT